MKNKKEYLGEPEVIASRIGKAKKDFEIHQGEVHIFIKKGDEISEEKVPKKYWENLKTEGVL